MWWEDSDRARRLARQADEYLAECEERNWELGEDGVDWTPRPSAQDPIRLDNDETTHPGDKLALRLTGDLREDLARYSEHMAAAAQGTIDALERITDEVGKDRRRESAVYAAGRRDALNEMARVIRDWHT